MTIERNDTMISSLWDSLTPRERIIKFHMGNSLRMYQSWNELTYTDRGLILNAGRILGMDYNRPLDPSSFAGAIKPKVETHH